MAEEKKQGRKRAKKGDGGGSTSAPKAARNAGRKGRKGREPQEAAQPPQPESAPPVEEPSAPPGEPGADEITGLEALNAVRQVLNACPSAKDSPALAFVLLDGDKLLATDDYAHHLSLLPKPITTAPLKVDVASMEALEAVLAGELKAGAAQESPVMVRWTGLVVSIRRAGEEHTLTLTRFDAGPDAEHLHLPVPDHAGLGAVDLKRLRSAVAWKGEGHALVYVAPDARQLLVDICLGSETIARSRIALVGASLGVRQPGLPFVERSTAPTSPAPERPAAAPAEAPGGAAAPRPAPGLALGAPGGWVMIFVPFAPFHAAMQEDFSRAAGLPTWALDGEGRVSFGPVPRGAPVDALVAKLNELCLPFVSAPCAPPSTFLLDPGAVPRTPVLALPAPAENPSCVVRLALATWDALDPEAKARLVSPSGLVRIVWTCDAEHAATEELTPAAAAALAEVLSELGLATASTTTAPLSAPELPEVFTLSVPMSSWDKLTRSREQRLEHLADGGELAWGLDPTEKFMLSGPVQRGEGARTLLAELGAWGVTFSIEALPAPRLAEGRVRVFLAPRLRGPRRNEAWNRLDELAQELNADAVDVDEREGTGGRTEFVVMDGRGEQLVGWPGGEDLHERISKALDGIPVTVTTEPLSRWVCRDCAGEFGALQPGGLCAPCDEQRVQKFNAAEKAQEAERRGAQKPRGRGKKASAPAAGEA